MVHGMQVILAGNVTKDPTFQTFPNGASKAKLRIAYTARWQNRDTGEWTDGPTSYVGVECWRGLAENVAICVRKGDPVLVRGRLTTRSYQNAAGETRLAVDVDADAIGHDLNRGVSQFNRIRRAAGDDALARNRALAAMSAVAARQAQASSVQAGPVDEIDLDDDAEQHDGVVDETAVAELAEELAGPLAEERTVAVSA
ncbi:MAG TPA: single-stranded DNA-binding protein [Streptosporangiaceae bacterium]|nr:single-stranded DNA-binding protein [Streptosporangiaceae bacterium]